MRKTQTPKGELGIEFIVELLLFLCPFGAEQMGLPHNFWIGLVCWIVGTVILVRMVWIFPLWARRLSAVKKSATAIGGVLVLAIIFGKPIMSAYDRQASRVEASAVAPSSQTQNNSGGRNTQQQQTNSGGINQQSGGGNSQQNSGNNNTQIMGNNNRVTWV